MSTWRYKARDPNTLEIRSSVIQAETDSAARAALRRAGLRPMAVVPVGRARAVSMPGASVLDRHLRARRVHLKADFYDSLSILLGAGIPLASALRALGQSRSGRGRVAGLAHLLADEIEAGRSLGEAMSNHPRWFDDAELAMIGAGQRSGEMGPMLERLAERQSRSGEFSAKLVGALAYPVLVGVVGVGVTLFLSNKTLPELLGILEDAQVDPPALSVAVMRGGQFAWSYGLWVLVGLLAALIGVLVGGRFFPPRIRAWTRARVVRWSPSLIRRSKTSGAMLALADLLDAGVTLVDSVRVVAPTLRGVVGGVLSGTMLRAADRIEQGEAITCLFSDTIWFSEEHRQLMRAGEEAGELPRTLTRVGELERRATNRLVDRFASLLEPAAIVLLAVLVGAVVMAAVLPLIRLQEIVG